MGSLLSSDLGNQRNVSVSLNDSTPITVTELPAHVDPISMSNPQPPTTQSGVYNYDPTQSVTKTDANLDSSGQSELEPENLNNFISNNGTLGGYATADDFKFNLFGTNFYPFKWLTLPTLYSSLGLLSSLGMIIGCVIPYVPQYLSIVKNGNSSGFSTFVCLTLLMANILRIAWW